MRRPALRWAWFSSKMEVMNKNVIASTAGSMLMGASILFAFTPGVALALLSPSVWDASNLPEGALIRAAGDIDVYIVKYVGAKKFKRLVLSPSVFDNYGHLRWEDIREGTPA